MNIKVCKHCNNEFDVSDKPYSWFANHVRWCPENPKRSTGSNLEYARSKITKASIKKAADKIKEHHKNGRYSNVVRNSFLGKKHSEASKKKMREAALLSPHRRLRKKVIEYRGIKLDSSWELALAKRLDELGVFWNRPPPIPWEDEDGIIHNYFPDFYLPEYNVFLDPKNPHAMKVQANKISILEKTYDNIILLKSLLECETFSP